MNNSSSIYENLPEEADMAFLYLEDVYFRQLSDAESNWNSERPLPDSYYVEYMSKVLAARGELQINICLTGPGLPWPISLTRCT